MIGSRLLTRAVVLSALLAYAVVRAEDSTDMALLKQLATELGAAAPLSGADDAVAYSAASQKLRDSKLLERLSGEDIVWGGQTNGQTLDPKAHNLTRFDPFIWRGEYLAAFMFSGSNSIQRVENYTEMAMDCIFRNRMDPGDYPYPFWHSASKWRSYQLTCQILFLFEKGKLIAAYRSHNEDTSRPTVARTFDGNWHWSSKEHVVEPHVSLYANQFSKDNPYVAALETAYRNLESTSRQSNCMTCHSPDNASKAKRLVILNFPNQALASRQTLVKQLEENLMPPEDKEKGQSAGVGDPAQKAALVTLAKTFVEAANKALSFEKEAVLRK